MFCTIRPRSPARHEALWCLRSEERMGGELQYRGQSRRQAVT
jgi:hypothetical protein